MPTKNVKKNSNGHLSTQRELTVSYEKKASKKIKTNSNGKLPTQRDIAESFDEAKLTEAEKEFIKASENVVKMMDEAEKNGFVW